MPETKITHVAFSDEAYLNARYRSLALVSVAKDDPSNYEKELKHCASL